MADFAYLSGGRLFVEVDGTEARAVESTFAEAFAARAASIARKNDWKTQGRGARFQMGLEGIPDELLQPRLEGALVRFTGLGRGRHTTELIYTLSTGGVSGLFAFSGGEEERLFHSAEVHVSEPACEPSGNRFACVMRGKDGGTHIGVLVPGQPGVTQLTVGDAMDSAPCWVPGEERLVFESRAYGYDKTGRVVDVAASTIQELDLKRGEVTTIAAIDGVECSAPRVVPNGTLYYLRRPVTKPTIRYSGLLWDVLLFPLRMLMAIVQWFNFFSLRYTGKPLVDHRNARAKQLDVKRAAMIGNLTRAATEARDEDDDEPATPKSWELIAKGIDGAERIIATRVTCFDVYQDGSAVWSDGRNVFRRTTDGQDVKLGKRQSVEQVIAIESASSS